MQLKLRKFENEINAQKNKVFTYNPPTNPKQSLNSETPKFVDSWQKLEDDIVINF